MISFSRLGQVGRLGNQLFQIAFITNFANVFGLDYALPYWKYSEYIDHNFNFTESIVEKEFDLVLREPDLGYQIEYFKQYLPQMQKLNVDIITGYFQSYRYFPKKHALEIFKANTKFKPINVNPNRSIAISVRRGDFVKHPQYNNIEAFQFRALLENFSNHKVFVFTDDFNYCKAEFTGSQFEFMEGLSDIEQLITMTKFEKFIVSNSTFSYWGPMLSPKVRTVLYPYNMFPNQDRCELYNEMYWPQEPHIYTPYFNEINK